MQHLSDVGKADQTKLLVTDMSCCERHRNALDFSLSPLVVVPE